MRHVKAELLQHEKDLDDEDDLDLEDDRRRTEHPFHHTMQHHHHHHQGYGEEHLKEEGMKPDCSGGGVPIPATKPKIWSLADTAACKTPPPPSHPHHQQYHHLHQQQHYPQQQQHHVPNQGHHHHSQQPWLGPGGAGGAGGGGGGGNGVGSSFALPSSAGMSPSAAATAPYSGAAARYGGFLSSSSGGQLHYNPNSSGSSSSASSSAAAAAGFPEVGTDTPPQTPPNMKVATPNGVIQAPPGGYCPGGNAASAATNGNPNNPYGANHPGSGYLSTSSGSASSASSFSSRMQSSPHKDFSPVGQNSILHQHQTTASLPPTEATTAFKPFYKG